MSHQVAHVFDEAAGVLQFSNAFHAKVAQLIMWAAAFGLDMAITNGENLADDDIEFWWVALEPGQEPPYNRDDWVVYECGRR